MIVLMKNANVKAEGQKGGKKANIKKDIMNLAFFHIRLWDERTVGVRQVYAIRGWVSYEDSLDK